MTTFEQLPNELILICFAYLDFCTIFEVFFCTNQRFNQLIQYQTKIHIDLSTISSRGFLTFCFYLNQLVVRSRNYPLAITAHDTHKLRLIVEDNLFQATFSKLKSLTLVDIDLKSIYSIIFDSTVPLYQILERLSLRSQVSATSEGYQNAKCLSNYLVSSKMKSLRYLMLNFEEHWCGCNDDRYGCPEYIDLTFDELRMEDRSLSNLETLIIGGMPHDYHWYDYTKVPFSALSRKLLVCLPKLKNLTISSILFDKYIYLERNQINTSTSETDPNVVRLNLKSIKFWFGLAHYYVEDVDTLERSLRDFFHNHKLIDATTIQLFYINGKNVLKEPL